MGEAMKTSQYRILYAEDVPCYGTVEIEARHDGEAIAKAVTHPWDTVSTHPQYELAGNARIVQIERGDEIVFDDEIPVDLHKTPETALRRQLRELVDALKKARFELAFQQQHFPRADDTELRETIHIADRAITKAEGGAP
jgi:hypothetical protein